MTYFLLFRTRPTNHSVYDSGQDLGAVKPFVAFPMRMSVFCSSRWVAKLCRSECSESRLSIPAVSAASWRDTKSTDRDTPLDQMYLQSK